MSSFGDFFKVSTCGESHGASMMAIVDGVPAGMALCERDIQVELDRRRPARHKYTTQRREPDVVRIISGVFLGKTTGTPIGLVIENTDQKSGDYAHIKGIFRPNHADFSYFAKYHHVDYRGGGRASARETAMRVAAGAIAKKIIASFGVQVRATLVQMGDISADTDLSNIDWAAADKSDFFCPDGVACQKFAQLIDQCRRDGDSVGAKISLVAEGVPAGLGRPVFDKLDARLAQALMSINAVKGVEIGDGMSVVAQFGKHARDTMVRDGARVGFLNNHAGGIVGGISTGQSIIAHIAFKPTPSITTPIDSLNVYGEAVSVSTKGRHDPCVGVRAVPIVEAMAAMVLADEILCQRAQMGRVGFNGFLRRDD